MSDLLWHFDINKPGRDFVERHQYRYWRSEGDRQKQHKTGGPTSSPNGLNSPNRAPAKSVATAKIGD